MKRILLSVIMLFVSTIAFAGNNDIYITQTGTGLTLTIDQIGATNTVGSSQTRATLSGTSMRRLVLERFLRIKASTLTR